MLDIFYILSVIPSPRLTSPTLPYPTHPYPPLNVHTTPPKSLFFYWRPPEDLFENQFFTGFWRHDL